jgi:hypothetical protein
VDRETALIVEVPEAEPLVGTWRSRLDRNADFGVPAHVTVLYPFAHPDAIDQVMLDRLRSTFAPFPAFDVVFDRTSWFGEEVLWLAPADDQRLRQLTAAAMSTFPQYPPYGGAIADPTPHLTIGELADLNEMREAETAVRPGLPVTGAVGSVSLLVQGADGRWSRGHHFPLGVEASAEALKRQRSLS